MTRAERVYLVAVAALAAASFSSRDGQLTWWPEGVLLLLLLPAVVPAMPLVYVVGASAWNLTHADAGGPMWPVTVAYALVLTGIGAANVFALRAVRGWFASRTAGAPGAGASRHEGRPVGPAGGGRS